MSIGAALCCAHSCKQTSAAATMPCFHPPKQAACSMEHCAAGHAAGQISNAHNYLMSKAQSRWFRWGRPAMNLEQHREDEHT